LIRDSRPAWLLAALAAVALGLLPLLDTPHVSDDFVNYTARWLSPAEAMQSMRDEIMYWVWSSGRIFVFSTVLKDFTFQVFEGLRAYKAWLLLLNLAAALAFAGYVLELTGSRLRACTALLALPLFTQMRDYHDPVVSFNGLFQLSAIMIMAALVAHLRFLRTGRGAWLAACAGAALLNLFFYEIAIITIVLLWLQQRTVPAAAAAAGARPMRVVGIAVLAYVAVMLCARLYGSHVLHYGNPAYGLGLDPVLVAKTLGKQLTAIVPFTFALLRPQDGNWSVHALPSFPLWLPMWQFHAAALAFGLAAFVAITRARAARAAGASAPVGVNDRTMLLVGLGLLLLPAMIISLVRRYQLEFNWGNGYSVVYLQIFGASLLGGWLCARVLAARRTRWVAAACAAYGIACAGNLVDNEAVALQLARSWQGQYPFTATLRSPDFRATCGDVPIITAASPWDEPRVVARAGFRTLTLEQFAAAPRPADGKPLEACFVRNVTAMGAQATVFVRATAGEDPRRALRPVSPLYWVALQPEGGERRFLPFPGCGSPPAQRFVAAWRFRDHSWALFALDAGAALPRDTQLFDLPCKPA
jgi:hypothetical protein